MDTEVDNEDRALDAYEEKDLSNPVTPSEKTQNEHDYESTQNTIVEGQQQQMFKNWSQSLAIKELTNMDNDPKAFSSQKKKTILAIIGFAASISPISSTIYYPALPDVQIDLNTTEQLVNATISTFTACTAIFPLIWASLSEVYGRRRIYILSFTIYVIASILCAVSKNITMLLVFRGISAAGSSSVMAMGAGTISDIYEPHARGSAFAVYTLGPMIGPAVGPIIGGYVNQYLGWRAVFWGLAILSFIILVVLAFLLPETWRPKASSILPESNSTVSHPRTNPFSALTIFKYPNMDLVFIYIGFMFLSFYCLNTTFTHTYSVQYSFSSGIVGLCYLPQALGGMVGSLVGGRYSDIVYRQAISKNNGTGWSEMRLRSAWEGAILMPLAYIAYGWLVQKNVSFWWPLVAQFVLDFALMLPNVTVNTYLADAFRRRAASATACNNLVRYIFAAIGPLIAEPGQRYLGDGWLYTILGILQLLPLPLLIFVHRYGEKWGRMRGDA